MEGGFPGSDCTLRDNYVDDYVNDERLAAARRSSVIAVT